MDIQKFFSTNPEIIPSCLLKTTAVINSLKAEIVS